MVFKIASIIMILLFSYASFVQFNDPDSLLWVVLYSLSIFSSALVLLKRSAWASLWGVLTIYLVTILYLSPHFADTSLDAFAGVGMNSLSDELVRELWGMVICALWTVVLIISQLKKQNTNVAVTAV